MFVVYLLLNGWETKKKYTANIHYIKEDFNNVLLWDYSLIFLELNNLKILFIMIY